MVKICLYYYKKPMWHSTYMKSSLSFVVSYQVNEFDHKKEYYIDINHQYEKIAKQTD